MSRYTPHWQGIIRGFQTSGNGPWQVSIEMPKGRNIYDGNPDHGPTIRFGISQVVHVLTDEGLAEVKAQALKEAADDLEADLGTTGPGNRRTGYGAVALDLLRLIRNRAQQIRDGE